MTEPYQTVGNIRRACQQITDHWEGSLEGPRVAGDVGGSAGSKEPPAPVSLDILDARHEAHTDLAHWARVVLEVVVDGEGHRMDWTLPDDDTQPISLAAFVGHWAERLTALDQPEAELCAEELTKHGRRLKSLALPDRRDWIPIGDCPITVADANGNSVECGAQVRAYDQVVDSGEGYRTETTLKVERIQFIRCPGCGHEDTLAWWMSQIVGNPEAKPLVTADELIAIVARDLGHILEHTTIRQWVHRNQIPKAGKDAKGRNLYDHAIVVALIREGKAA